MNDLKLYQIKKGREILVALKRYGIMNRKTLQKVVPSIKHQRNFRRTLESLCERQLIVKKYDTVFGITGIFYQLNQRPRIREMLAHYLDCEAEHVKQRQYNYKELFHEQISALIAYDLNKNFPEALVLRDFELARSLEAQKVIPHLNLFDQPKPDVLLLVPSLTNGRIISVAIEFERTAKSKDRILHKLKYYTANTHIDGVIYICSKNRIINNLNEIYDSKVLERAVRIKHYGKNFLLTSVFANDVEKSLNQLRNQNNFYYPLTDYIINLKQYSNADRRDHHFEQRPTVCVDEN